MNGLKITSLLEKSPKIKRNIGKKIKRKINNILNLVAIFWNQPPVLIPNKWIEPINTITKEAIIS